MARTKLIALLMLFAALSVASAIAVYTTHQLPTQEQKTTTLASYQQKGTYDYIAKLKPNTLYNQSTLKPGQGTLYTKIIDHINITFTYTFTSSRPTNTSIEYQTNTDLESPGNWIKNFTAAEMVETFQIANRVNFTKQTASTTLFLNITRIDELVKAVDGQIGTKTSQYNLMVKPKITIIAKINITQTDVRTIYETFAPSLTIEFRKETPNYISIESLEETKPGTIYQTQITPLPWVMNQRNASYAFSVAALLTLTVIAFIYIKAKPTTPPKHKEKPLKKIIKEYKEIIAETIEKPPLTPNMTIIKMATLEDLAKISEALMKPILHIQKPPKSPDKETTHIFYIIDNNTKYQYETKAPYARTDKNVIETYYILPSFVDLIRARIGLILTAFGSVILFWVGWLTWYDITTWGKSLALIFFGSRTGEVISLGIGMKLIYYLLIGSALFLSGIFTFFRKRRRKM